MDAIPEIYLASIFIIIGFVGLIYSADKFVVGAASMAKTLGMPPLLIGLTIVSFGTSAPEIVVSINAALNNTPDLAVGNALGSNIANIALVLGATALVSQIPIQSHILKDEMPILLVITGVTGWLLFDGHISQLEGIFLLGLLAPTLILMVKQKKKDQSPTELIEEGDIELIEFKPAIIWFLVGLALLIISSKMLVWGAEVTALHFGVPPLIIGLTVIAIGTSLPELAASITSALKGQHDIALGNIIGSNIFNLLGVISIPAIIKPITELERTIFYRDFMAMGGLTLALAALIGFKIMRSKANNKKAGIGRLAGIGFLTLYFLYCFKLFSDLT